MILSRLRLSMFRLSPCVPTEMHTACLLKQTAVFAMFVTKHAQMRFLSADISFREQCHPGLFGNIFDLSRMRDADPVGYGCRAGSGTSRPGHVCRKV